MTPFATRCQPPDDYRWMATDAPRRHVPNPSVTRTVPDANRAPSRRATRRAWLTANVPTLFVGPPAVETETTPAEAPAGTTAVICTSEFTVKEPLATSLNETPVAPVKPEPSIDLRSVRPHRRLPCQPLSLADERGGPPGPPPFDYGMRL